MNDEQRGRVGAQAGTYAYAGAFVDELSLAGVTDACICPGSRSTPLAVSLAAQRSIKLWMHIDERCAAFFALGMAKASGRPVAVVSTSGTAAANFLPAIVEARFGRVPLLVLTADRPHELRDNGAPQSIDQIHLYGGNVKWFVDMPLPEASPMMLRHVRATAVRSVATALDAPAGPVHVNMPFREPLTPPDGFWDHRDVPDGPGATDGADRTTPYAAVVAGKRQVPPDALDGLARTLLETPRGLIVCGPHTDPTLAPAVSRLAANLGYPVLADALSGVRSGTHDRSLVIDSYDTTLRDGRAARLTADVALHLGGVPTSRALLTYMRGAKRHVLVDGAGGWRDPAELGGEIVHADAALLCEALAEYAAGRANGGDVEWIDTWRRNASRARGTIASYLEGLEEPFEGKVFAELSSILPDGVTLFAGNSMPVRDLDAFFAGSERDIRCLSNRGANGIDGVVSSALGAALASRRPLVLVIGDLSFYHDLNGLLAARLHGISATIILLNNDGGGIFSFLQQADDTIHFEELFGTPTGLDFQPAARMYGCGFERVSSWAGFRRAVSASLGSPGVQVIEMRTDRARNVALHREILAAVSEAVWH